MDKGSLATIQTASALMLLDNSAIAAKWLRIRQDDERMLNGGAGYQPSFAM
jgi:hypothetical protein